MIECLPPIVGRPWRALPLLAALIVLPGCEAPPAPPQMPPPEVSVAPPIQREVQEWHEFTGRLVPVETVEVRSRVTGYIAKVHFRDGQDVRAGDLLFTIDEREFQATLKVAEAQLAEAIAQAELARSEAARARTLIERRVISAEEHQQRVAAEATALAAVQAARAAVERARLDVEFTRVTAPISGRIGRAEVTAGNLVTGGAMNPTLLTTIVSLDPIYAEFEGSERAYLHYQELARNGDRPSSRDAPNLVYLGLANEEDYPRQGHMVFVDNRVNPSSGTIRARALFDNPDGALTPGLFARIRLVGGNKYPALLVQDRAVLSDQGNKYVLVLAPDNTLQYRGVTLGPIIDGLRVIRSGLGPEDAVVVNGMARVRPGMPVRPSVVSMESPDAAAPAADSSTAARPGQG